MFFKTSKELDKKPNVLESLSGAEVTDAREAAGLQVFGLRWTIGGDHDYLTLDDALQQQLLEVTEVNEGGQVPTIKITNKSARMVFVMAGEELVGGKQNRVLNASMMVPAKGQMPVPVTCVERGRWGYRSKRFSSGSTSSYGHLRSMISSQVSASYRTSGKPTTDQGAVWREVDRKMAKMGTSSSSDALHDMFRQYAQKLEQMVANFSLPDDCNGAAFAINGKLAGADLFDKPATLKKLWSKLVKSYAADAFEEPEQKSPPLEAARVRDWLKSATSAEQHWFDSPGVGKDVRIEGQHLVGATLVLDERPVHLELFQEDGGK